VIPHGRALDVSSSAGNGENLIEVQIESMEFLGSFWRTHMRSTYLQNQQLIADFSINAERRLGLTEGMTILVELPKSRLLIFDGKGKR
jgi:iron(III) transport system ATP-binding protein